METLWTVADRIRAALEHMSAEWLIIAPDCGMKYLNRRVAFDKLKAMVDGARFYQFDIALPPPHLSRTVSRSEGGEERQTARTRRRLAHHARAKNPPMAWPTR